MNEPEQELSTPPSERDRRPARFTRLNARYYDDARIRDVSEAAELLYVRARCLADSLGTAGLLSDRQLWSIEPEETLTRFEDLQRRLVEVGLWEDVGGYVRVDVDAA